MFDWLEKKTTLPFPILMVLLMGFGGMAVFILLVIFTTIENIPPDYEFGIGEKVVGLIPLIIAGLMIWYVAKKHKNPEQR